MKGISEKIGYAIEHLICIELESRGIEVGRNERPSNESIKCDITFKLNRDEYIVFATHTRTQGMTNRKFYRTFEELSERRIINPKSICIDVTLVRGASGVREQQDLIFEQCFDASFQLISKDLESSFVKTVESFGKNFSLETTRTNFNNFSTSIHKAVKRVVSKILKTQGRNNDPFKDFWRKESQVKKGKIKCLPNGASIKFGMKMLTLIPTKLASLEEISKGSKLFAHELHYEIEIMKEFLIVNNTIKKVPGIYGEFSKHICAAANFLKKNNLSPEEDWYLPYLKTDGAKRLYSDIMNKKKTVERNSYLTDLIINCKSKNQLKRLFLSDYYSDNRRCDLIDMALRMSPYTQNQISVDLTDLHSTPLKLSDSVGFLIRKSKKLDIFVGNIDEYIENVAHLVWNKDNGHFERVDDKDFFQSRIKTFFSNAYICPELYLLDHLLPQNVKIAKQRFSVLPRLSKLPTRYWMSVKPSIYLKLNDGKVFFIITISTPEARHHKHKEFSGKLRAIRYNFDAGKLEKDKTNFVVIIDGNWTKEQIGALSNAGWGVSDWESFLDIINQKTKN